MTTRVNHNLLRIGNFSAETLARRHGTPLYVYDADVIRARYASFTRCFAYKPLRIYYACKANTNLEILKTLRRLGARLETVSPAEILLGLKAGFTKNQILYTCSNITPREIEFLIQQGITVNLDSFSQLEKWGVRRPRSRVSIRVNQGIGMGHHRHVVTGGEGSKFGIYFSDLEQVKALAARHRLRIVGLQQHIGSNILDEQVLLKAARALLETARGFDALEFVDFGGGFGVPYRPDDPAPNLMKFGAELTTLFRRFCREYGRDLALAFEPGRYLVCESGVLLARVTDIKVTPFRKFVGVDSGFNHLARPAVYGAYHPVVNASRVRGRREIVSVAGNLCESGDLFAKDRAITRFEEGDLVAILNAGAYGYSMSSNYNLRPRPAEVLVSGRNARLIRKRETLDCMINQV